MIIDELVVHNFGPFAERQRILLTPTFPEKPIVLFGGLNGYGKTTLLDALQLCLYGPFSNSGNRDGLSYNEYLRRCVHRNSGIKEAAVEIAFRHATHGHENRYRLHRSWRIGKSGCQERFEVLKNRRREDALAENWISEVEDLIPPNIAGLFLFDGEQIEQYAASDSSTQLIGTAIHNLLGLDIVDQLSKDLVIYSRRKRMEEKDDPARPNIVEAEGRVTKLEGQISELEEERKILSDENLKGLNKKLGEIENEYRRLGGELYEDRIRIEQEFGASEEELENGSDRLRSFASGSLPLLLVQDVLEELQIQDRKEEEYRRAKELASALEKRDMELIEELHKQDFDDGKIDAISTWLQQSRLALEKVGPCNVTLQLSASTRSDLLSLLNDGIDNLHKAIRIELTNRSKVELKAQSIRQKHASIPRGDLIGDVIRRRDLIRTEIAILEDRLMRVDKEIERLTRERRRSQEALMVLIEGDARAVGVREDRARILEHVGRVRETLEKFRVSVIERHTNRIAALVFDSYQKLLRKSSLVTRLEIDPNSFVLTLFGRDGYPLGPDRLSAGERQLLAIALLWGLAKASGRALPTAIDTPLGRLDASHRRFLVKRYFPLASHQVLLFSTDEEIAGEYFDELRPFIGRCYNLSYEDKTASTKIEEGYFEGQKVN